MWSVPIPPAGIVPQARPVVHAGRAFYSRYTEPENRNCQFGSRFASRFNAPWQKGWATCAVSMAWNVPFVILLMLLGLIAIEVL